MTKSTTKSTPMSTKAVLLSAIAALSFAAPALAAAPMLYDVTTTGDTVSIEFAEGVVTDGNIETVYSVLKDEAKTACTETDRIRRVNTRCAKSLMNDFVTSVANPALTELHEETR